MPRIEQQPRQNISKEAIDIWQQTANRGKGPQSNSLKRQQHTHTGSPSSSPSNLTNSSTPPVIKPRLQRVATTASKDQQVSDEQKLGPGISITNSQPSPARDLFVQISQHSSLDRDQYLHYHSSLSTRSYLSSAPPHEDSGLGESSPAPEDSSPWKSIHGGIVPDSQSLPGSSDYHPTAKSTEDASDHIHERFHHSYCSCHSTNDGLESSNSLEAPYSDPIEDSSGFYVAESPENQIYSQRSASVPAQSFIESSSSSTNRERLLAAFIRSTSDPASVHYTSQGSLSGSGADKLVFVSSNKGTASSGEGPRSTGFGSQVRAMSASEYHSLCVMSCEMHVRCIMHRRRVRLCSTDVLRSTSTIC